MKTEFSAQLAQHVHQMYFGGNWSASCVQDALNALDVTMINERLGGCHSIAELAYHIHYYGTAILGVLEGQPLEAHDRYSFDCPSITDIQQWEHLKQQWWQQATRLITAIEALPDDALQQIFFDPKFGSVARNILGFIEHTHYHLGQIVIITKTLRPRDSQS